MIKNNKVTIGAEDAEKSGLKNLPIPKRLQAREGVRLKTMKRELESFERFRAGQPASGLFCLPILGALLLIIGLASCASLSPGEDTRPRDERAESPTTPPWHQRPHRSGAQPFMDIPKPVPGASTPKAPSIAEQESAAPEGKRMSTPTEQQPAPIAPFAPKRAQEKKSEKTEEDPQYVMLNFENAKLPDVVRTIMEILGYNYIIDPQIGGVVNIHTSGKVARGDLFPILETLLKIHNATVVKQGAIYHVVPLAPGKGLVPPVLPRGQPLSEDTLIIQVIPLNFIQAAEMANILKPFLFPGAVMVPYVKENLLLVMDFASNIRKFLSMVELFDIDIFQKAQIRMYLLKYALAKDMVQEMQHVFESYEMPTKSGRGLGVRLIPIQRLNAILAISSVPGALELADRWVAQLDRMSEEDVIRVFVYRCQNQKAEDIAAILTDIYGKAEAARPERARPAEKAPTRPTRVRAQRQETPSAGRVVAPGTPPPPSMATVSPAPALAPGQAPPTARAAAEAAPPAPGAPPAVAAPPAAEAPLAPTAPAAPEAPPGPAAPAARLEVLADVAGEVTFHVDKVTNSVIIRASERDYRTILKTIQQLDIYPRQVLIEVVIAEITLDESMKWGFEWQKIGSANSATYSLGFLGGASTITPGLEYTVVKTGELMAALRAVAAQNKVDILSSPHIIASDNTAASISISDEIPIVTTLITTTDPTAGVEGRRVSDQTIEYRSVGVILTVTPHINDYGLVRMDIQQTVSEVSEKTVANVDSPVFFNRTAKTTLTVNNSQTIVIGGLIKEKKGRVRAGIPFLYKIPVLGFLFGYDSRQINKTELMILITPHVIRGLDDADLVTREFQNKVKTIQETMKIYR